MSTQVEFMMGPTLFLFFGMNSRRIVCRRTTAPFISSYMMGCQYPKLPLVLTRIACEKFDFLQNSVAAGSSIV
jgi:hypothetical protein